MTNLVCICYQLQARNNFNQEELAESKEPVDFEEVKKKSLKKRARQRCYWVKKGGNEREKEREEKKKEV